MKKFICFVLLFIMIGVMVGCTGDNTVKNEEQSIRTDLTCDNIEDYILITTEVTEPDLFDSTYMQYCEVKFKVKIASKQNVEYENLIINFEIQAEGTSRYYGWDEIYFANSMDKFSGTLSIPYNGIWEETFRIKSRTTGFVSEDPDLKLVITSVSGTVVQK